MTSLLPNPYNPEHDIDYMKIKAHQKLLEAAEIDSVDQEQDLEAGEQPGKKMKGPTGLFDIFQLDQLDSNPILKSSLQLLREENPQPYYFRDEISSCQDSKVFLPLQTSKLIDFDYFDYKEANTSPVEADSDKIAKIQELDTAELERLEAAEEERRETEQPKEKERKTTVVEGFTQWVSNLCLGIWGLFSNNKAAPTVTAPESNRGTKASEQPLPEAFNSKPQLKAPEAVDVIMLQRFLENEKAALQHQKELQQSEAEAALLDQLTIANQQKTSVGMTPEEEVKLLENYIELMKKAQGLRKTEELLSKDAIMAQQKRYEEIQEQMNKEFQKIAERSWIGKIVQWISAAATTVMIVAAVVTVATGGLAAAIAGMIGAAAALVAGIAQATKAVTDYQTREGQARIKEKSNTITELKDKMRSQVGKMQKAMEAINSQWQMMSQAAKAHYEANKFALTGRSSSV